MNRFVCFAIVLCLALSASAFANSGELLSFQGLGDNLPVGNFYNGGGLATTPNYGVTFSSNFFGLKSYLNGGSGNFLTTVGGNGGAQFTIGTAIFMGGTLGSPVTGTMNVAPGFSNGLNFYYTAGFTGGQTETVTIWSGTNGTGTVLATMILGNNNGSCSGGQYCNWSVAGASFTGTALSVTFSGPANEIGLADITIGASTTAVAEPSPVYLLATGIAALGIGRMRKLFAQ
jgi:hypothetical protein